jgi:hypothetical protein
MKTGPKVILIFPMLLVALLLIRTPQAGAAWEGELASHQMRYASEDFATIQITNKTLFESAGFQARTRLFFESGPRGTWTLDPDPLRFHFLRGKSGEDEIWIGRDHPLRSLHGPDIEPTSAIGAIWTQNQIDALNPRVSGWVGAGMNHSLDGHWGVRLAYSPIFIPNLGPRLGFSDWGNLNPARFARVPPSTVETAGVSLPIRYQLRLNQLSEIIFRHQAFSGIDFDSKPLHLDLYYYTAPKPEPIPVLDSKIAVEGSAVNAHVAIMPQFPQEHWTGLRLRMKEWFLSPTLEFAQNIEDTTLHFVSVAGSFGRSVSHPPSIGFLARPFKADAPPSLSDLLFFFRLPLILTRHLATRLLVESTLFPQRRSLYWVQDLEYAVKGGFSGLITMKVLAGENGSYFGEWRNESSLSIGLRKTW